MAVFAKTEIDVLREASRKATIVAIEDPTESYENRDSRDQVKLAIRIWTTVGKFVRSQCNRGRVVDTNCFGTFARAGTLGAQDDDYFVYCAGPNSAFTNKENRENISDIAQSVSSLLKLIILFA